MQQLGQLTAIHGRDEMHIEWLGRLVFKIR